MDNQKVFDMLSELEEDLYYKMQNPEELAPFWTTLAGMHMYLKTMLCQWHNITGCTNSK